MWITFLLQKALRKMVTNISDKEQDPSWPQMSINKWKNTHKNTIEWQEHQMHCPFVYCTNRTCFQLTWWNAVLGSGGKEIVHQKPYYVYKMPKITSGKIWIQRSQMMDYDLERKYILFLLEQERESKTLILKLEYLIAVLFITETCHSWKGKLNKSGAPSRHCFFFSGFKSTLSSYRI